MNFLPRNMPVIAFALLSTFAEAGVIETSSTGALTLPTTQAEAAVPRPLTAASLVLDLGERIMARSSQITRQQLVTQGVRALTPRPGNVRSALRGISSDHIVLTHSAARR